MTANKLFLGIIAILLTLTSQIFAQRGPSQGRYKPLELIVQLEPGYSVDSINAKYGTFTKGHQIETDVYLLRVPAGRDVEHLAEQIAAEPGVIYCQPNYYLMAPEGLQRSSPFLDQQVKGTVETQPAASELRVSEVHETSTGSGVTIALIDGGVDFNHPWFTRQAGPLVSRWDFVDGDSLAFDELDGSCTGHGTFVAGILRLMAPDAAVNVYRVLDTGGVGDGYSISSAVLMALNDGCDVINLSLGMSGVHDGLDEALKLARQQGVLIIASAGNDSTDLASLFPFPASRDYCIAVAALDSIDRKADFSNFGLKVDLCAPGTWIYAPYPDSMYAWWDGTSFSAPFVSALAALALSADTDLTMTDVDSLIRTTAVSIDSLNPEYEGLLGQGIVCPVALINTIDPVSRGDWTGDNIVDLRDLTSMISYLTGIGQPPSPYRRGDVTCNDLIDLSDLSLLVAYLVGLDVELCSAP